MMYGQVEDTRMNLKRRTLSVDLSKVAVGSAFVGPVRTAVGALIRWVAGFLLDPATEATKKAIKDAYKQ